MSTPFTAPQNDGNNKTKLDVPNLPNGTYPGILVSIVDVGTHTQVFNNEAKRRRILKMSFEIPNQKEIFYAEDTEAKPRMFTVDFTYMMVKNQTTGKKSNLLNFVEGIKGVLNPTEYHTFDFLTLLGQLYNLNIVQYQKKDGTIGNKIQSVTAFQNFWPNDNLQRTNELVAFHTSQGFDTLPFASLPFWLRNSVKESEEAIMFAQKGGKFSKLDENGQLIYEILAVPTSATNSLSPIIRMKNPAHNYQEFIKNGWTDETMIANGYAERIAPAVPVPTPAPAIPQPSAPIAPPIPTPQTPIASPVTQEPKLVSTNPSFTIEQCLEQGWTVEQLIQFGHAKYEQVSAPIAQPLAPQAPPVPVASVPNPTPIPTQASIPTPAPVPSPVQTSTPAPTNVNAAIDMFKNNAPNVGAPNVNLEEEHDDLPF